MRWLAISWPLILAGCASAPPAAPLHGARIDTRDSTLERPWLMPQPTDQVTLFDTRTLQALRKLDEIPALNQNANGRRVRHPGMWAGIGVGAFVGTLVVVDAVEDTTEDIFDNFFECFFEAFFGGDDCDSE